MDNHVPLQAPCTSSASRAYCEQVGRNRQGVGRPARTRWYATIGRRSNRATGLIAQPRGSPRRTLGPARSPTRRTAGQPPPNPRSRGRFRVASHRGPRRSACTLHGAAAESRCGQPRCLSADRSRSRRGRSPGDRSARTRPKVARDALDGRVAEAPRSWPGHRSIGSGRQPCPAAAPTARKDRSAGAGGHALAEPMALRSLSDVRLERTLHFCLLDGSVSTPWPSPTMRGLSIGASSKARASRARENPHGCGSTRRRNSVRSAATQQQLRSPTGGDHPPPRSPGSREW